MTGLRFGNSQQMLACQCSQGCDVRCAHILQNVANPDKSAERWQPWPSETGLGGGGGGGWFRYPFSKLSKLCDLTEIPNKHKCYIHDVVEPEYIEYVSNFHQALKFTSSVSELVLPFLDISLRINNSNIQTSVYYKKTDAHNYLHQKVTPFRNS